MLILSSSSYIFASYPQAFMFYQHGLVNEAKSQLIHVIFDDSSESEKAAAYYLLGTIAFSEDRIQIALETWQELLERYPASKEAVYVEQRILEMRELVGEIEKETVDDIVASSYIAHGDFWSRGKRTTFSIDTSWIPKVEAALKWYAKTIEEFPHTSASRTAYEKKLQTILGWTDTGPYGRSYGIREDYDRYLPKLLETFYAFEKMHPEATTLQAFRYQIAQVYWNQRDWENTREWLSIIVETSGDVDSYYSDLAQRRLLKVEY